MKNKYVIFIISLLIVFAPITNLVHQIAPAYLFGKSVWVAMPAIILAIFFVVNLTEINRNNQIACLLGVFFVRLFNIKNVFTGVWRE
jgi:hypothetical protein